MSYIKTWVERCDEHPDHQSGMVSNGMIQARMQEEIDDLREEIEGLRAQLEERYVSMRVRQLEEALDAERQTAERQTVRRLREAPRWYADPRNHFPVERRSPGDPDPAVVFVEEPPIMRDGGKRAREALELKP